MSTPGPSASADALLRRVLAPDPEPFALLYRPAETGAAPRADRPAGACDGAYGTGACGGTYGTGARGGGLVEILTGDITEVARIADIPLPASPHGPAGPDVLALVPYRQLAERGFPAPDDGTPLLAMTVRESAMVSPAELEHRVPDPGIRLEDGHFDITDDAYADLVRRVLADEIGSGEGANFVLRRTFTADITGYSPAVATAFFRRLLAHESGVHWTFLVHTGTRTLVGASPERHVAVRAGTAVMNPISGTYRYPPSGPTPAGILDFLADPKEVYELYMVVDEELKMMAQVCDGGVRLVGPFLKEMARLAHTEYVIEGHTARDVREVLRETLFAPTVTGSPLENASRVIARHEPGGRGYYGGVAALIGRDGAGGRTLDSAILIRTADISPAGRMSIGVGATLVRDSDPLSEVAETRAKANGLLGALQAHPAGSLARHADVRAALRERNADLAAFWLDGPAPDSRRHPRLGGLRVLVVDAEDRFTAMIDHQLRSLGLLVTVRRHDEPYRLGDHDLVVLGPGPGDPRETGGPRSARLRADVDRLLVERRPFLAVCLSHQILGGRLGLHVRRRDTPHQGVRRDIDLFGRPERVGFYNSFSAYGTPGVLQVPGVGPVEVCGDAATGEVHALRGPFFAGVQFHAESVLTRGGERILATLLTDVLGPQRCPVRP